MIHTYRILFKLQTEKQSFHLCTFYLYNPDRKTQIMIHSLFGWMVVPDVVVCWELTLN